MEQMLGAYAPSPDGSPYTKKFPEEESPSGMLARSGTYNVRSRVIDDDGQIYIGAFFFLGLRRFLARGSDGPRETVDCRYAAYTTQVLRDGTKGQLNVVCAVVPCTQVAVLIALHGTVAMPLMVL